MKMLSLHSRAMFTVYGKCLVYYPLQRGNRLYTSESDICRHQILTYKDDPRAEIIKIFTMTTYTLNICIKMNRKELTKSLMMISN